MTTTKVNPGETYQAHVGGNGDAGTVAATWTAEDYAILGARVSDIVNDGYTVTPWAT